MVTKDYSKSRMRENRTYGSVRGGQSNLIPSTRLTAFQAEGCGIALSGDEYEVSVTDLPFCIIRHEKHSADWLAALASPYPAAPDFPLCRGQNRFLCFPAETWLHG